MNRFALWIFIGLPFYASSQMDVSQVLRLAFEHEPFLQYHQQFGDDLNTVIILNNEFLPEDTILQDSPFFIRTLSKENVFMRGLNGFIELDKFKMGKKKVKMSYRYGDVQANLFIKKVLDSSSEPRIMIHKVSYEVAEDS